MGAECQSCINTLPRRYWLVRPSGGRSLRPMTHEPRPLADFQLRPGGGDERGDGVRRREFILLGSAAATAALSCPRPLRAQPPVIGFLRGSTADGSVSVL